MIRYWKPEGKAVWRPYQADKRPPKRARYATILSLSEEWNENATIAYSGPFYTDFDGDIDRVLTDMRTALRTLELNYDVPLDSLFCYFTGGRGFHALVPQRLFNTEPDSLLPLIYKRMAYKMFNLTTVDMSIYSGKRGRMWRIVNRRRPNGNYKIPVTITEIFDQSADWFVKKCAAPRTRFTYPDQDDFEIVEPLARLFKQCKLRVQEEQKNFEKDPVTTEQIAGVNSNTPCMVAMSEVKKLRKPEIFNRYAMVLAGYLQAKPDIDFFNDFLSFNFNDSEHYDTPQQRKEHIVSLKRYFSKGEYAFSCDYVRALNGIKFDCTRCPLYISPQPSVKSSKYTLCDIKEMFQEYMLLNKESLEMIDVALAAIISIFLPDDPVWLLIVAPPASAKTELINAISTIDHTYMISEYTPKTMASGKSGETALLEKLKPLKTLLFKDFTSILEMRSEDKAAIFAQLRELYDGYYRKIHGNAKVVEWRGKLGIIAAVTEIIDTQYKISKILGERFIQYRLEEPDPVDVARIALKSSGKEEAVRKKIKQAVKSYVASRDISAPVELEERFGNEIVDLAVFAVKTRTTTVRDWRHHVELIPHSEGPARLAKQLKVMAQSLALIQKKSSVDQPIMRIIRKIAFDSITSLKQSIVSTLCENGVSNLTTAQLAEKVGYPPSTVKEVAQDLVGQQILFVELTDNEIDASKPYVWSLGVWGEYFKKQLFRENDADDIPF